jgi:predicted dehydrogenase
MEPIRIGVLGAARIVPAALTRPALEVPEVQVSAVAARDRGRAERFARKHRIPRVLDSYASLVADPEIDAVYNPLPNSLHCEWTIRALEAGKHVLCEKPLASNGEEAARMADAARLSGRVLMEAFHWRYHPVADRMIEVVRSGRIGRVQHVEASMCFPLLSRGDIRYNLALAGGATMDAGCYCVSMLRHLSGEEPVVVRAAARLASPGVDRCMTADMKFPGGATGRMTCSFWSTTLLRMSASVRGDRGEVSIVNPILPQWWHRLTVRTPEGRASERVTGPATYTCQLRAFVRAVRSGEPPLTGTADSLANMRVIDAIYTAASLPLRGPAVREAA